MLTITIMFHYNTPCSGKCWGKLQIISSDGQSWFFNIHCTEQITKCSVLCIKVVGCSGWFLLKKQILFVVLQNSLAHTSEVEFIPACECIRAVVPVPVLWFMKWCRSHQQESCVLFVFASIIVCLYNRPNNSFSVSWQNLMCHSKPPLSYHQ